MDCQNMIKKNNHIDRSIERERERERENLVINWYKIVTIWSTLSPILNQPINSTKLDLYSIEQFNISYENHTTLWHITNYMFNKKIMIEYQNVAVDIVVR